MGFASRRRLLVLVVLAAFAALVLWFWPWVLGAATLVYGTHLCSRGWSWRRAVAHLVGMALLAGAVVVVAATFGPGPGLLAAVVSVLAWRWDRARPSARLSATVPWETQLEAAYAEGFNRGQREHRRVQRTSGRSVPAFDPDDPDSF